MKPLGQIAYEAYCESLGQRKYLKWDQLAPWLQEAWENGARAAIHQYNIEENDE